MIKGFLIKEGRQSYMVVPHKVLEKTMIKAEVIANPRKPDGGLGELTCNVCGSKTGSYVNIFKKYIIDKDSYVHFDGVNGYPTEGTVCKGCLLKWVEMIDKNLLDQCSKTECIR